MKKFIVLLSTLLFFSSCNMHLRNQNVEFPPAESDYKSIVVISDVHMCDSRAINGTTFSDSKYNNISYTSLKKNINKTAEFLDWVKDNKNWISELILNGDIFDQWVVPAQLDVLAIYGSEREFVKAIATANDSIISRIKDIADCGIKVTAIPGNHDMAVTKEDYYEIFGDKVQYITTYDKNQNVLDTKGLGVYYPQSFTKKNSSFPDEKLFDNITGKIVIEHGHRYDLWNCPDLYSNRKSSTSLTDGVNVSGISEDANLPIGFFVTRMNTSKKIENASKHNRSAVSADEDWRNLTLPKEDTIFYKNRDKSHSIYEASWKAMWTAGLINTSVEKVKTNFDSYTSTYNINDFMLKGKDTRKIYTKEDLESTWENMKKINKVPNPGKCSYYEGTTAVAFKDNVDDCAETQYFSVNKEPKIVIFGHTHDIKLKYYHDKDHIYANSGTWVDDNIKGASFVVLTPVIDNEGHKILVDNFDFSSKENITKNFRTKDTLLK